MASWWKIRSSAARVGSLVALALLAALGSVHCAPVAPPNAPAQCTEARAKPANAAPAGDYAALPAASVAAAPVAPQLRVVPQFGHVGAIKRVGYTRGGRYLISVADEVKVWDPPTGLLLATLQIPGESLLGFAAHPDGKRLVAGGKQGTISVWNVEDAVRLATWKLPGGDWA
ncbi:MAG TPA: hypothetical protein VEX18_12235, partial [Polyangiaceae bacterium]|nr:hypothetical protein [Polyangiaceae bacterium]